MTNPKHTSSDLVERLRGDWPEILVEKHWMMDSDAIDKQREEAADRIEALEAENERLREALDAVWKEATTMRNASKLVGPYPTSPADNRIWARSMYHAGKRIMEMLKAARAALDARHD